MGNVIVFEGDSVGLDNRAKQTLDEMMPIFSGKLNIVEIRGTTVAQSLGVGQSKTSTLRR